MILVIDNYDSFTYNLVQVFAAQGADVKVVRNDDISVDGIASLKPDALVVSPGPCTPNEAGVSVAAIRAYSGSLPILGVCLGMQSIAVAFGATVSHAQRIMHGKTSQVSYDASPLCTDLGNPFQAGRYHSLAIVPDTLPATLVVDAQADDGEIMGIHHVSHPTYGVQFHPESVLTPEGPELLGNFLKLAASH
ncbi:MAG: anthranilate synthase/aminodeoxychorismate synthase-like glutamine amidotransferase [Candidatus Promineifilaceae bacterium]|jgi:anthranilate synthase/aminodeoxychorismate synthase-like glutamine amidotransferase